MKLKNKKTNNRKKIIVFCATAIVLVGVVFFVIYKIYSTSSDNSSQIDIDTPPTSEQIKQGESIKDTSVNKGGSSGSDTPPAPIQNQNSTKSTVEVEITAANYIDSFYMIRAMISVIDNQGSCTLTLSKPGQNSIKKTANVQPQANISTCQGFNVGIDEFPVGGDWDLKIDYSSDKYEGSISKRIQVVK